MSCPKMGRNWSLGRIWVLWLILISGFFMCIHIYLHITCFCVYVYVCTMASICHSLAFFIFDSSQKKCIATKSWCCRCSQGVVDWRCSHIFDKVLERCLAKWSFFCWRRFPLVQLWRCHRQRPGDSSWRNWSRRVVCLPTAGHVTGLGAERGEKRNQIRWERESVHKQMK